MLEQRGLNGQVRIVSVGSGLGWISQPRVLEVADGLINLFSSTHQPTQSKRTPQNGSQSQSFAEKVQRMARSKIPADKASFDGQGWVHSMVRYNPIFTAITASHPSPQTSHRNHSYEGSPFRYLTPRLRHGGRRNEELSRSKQVKSAVAPLRALGTINHCLDHGTFESDKGALKSLQYLTLKMQRDLSKCSLH